MCQMTGRRDFDERTRLFAHCFDADIVVAFAGGQKDNHGRACNARPELGGHAVMSEGGSNGLLDEDDIRYHLDGVLNCAVRLGIIDGPSRPPQRRQQVVSGFHRLAAPQNARSYPRVRAGQLVHAGDVLADLRDLWGQPIGRLTAPVSGPVVFCLSHPVVAANEVVIGIGEPSA
jgi:predicted deacylase